MEGIEETVDLAELLLDETRNLTLNDHLLTMHERRQLLKIIDAVLKIHDPKKWGTG